MNNVTATVNVTELTAVKLPKARPVHAGGEFRDMLSGALKAKNKSAALSSHAKTGEPPAAADAKTAKIRSKHAKAAQSNDATEPQGAEAGVNAVTPNVDESVQTDESANPEEIRALSKVPSAQVTPIPAQPAESQQSAPIQTLQTAELEAPETAAQTTKSIPPDSQVQAAADQAQPARTEASQTASAAEADSASPERMITEEMAKDIVSTETTGQSPETQAARVYPNQMHDASDNAEQSRFDELIAKAAHVLEQSKAETGQTENASLSAEAAGDTVLPLVAEETAAPETAAEAIPENDAGTGIETKQEPREAVTGSGAPKFEQRPLKEIPKTDEAVLGMLHPKPREIPVPDVIAIQASAQPAGPPEQAEQIRIQVVENLEKETMVFNMQLHPQELGRVDVRMVLESGRLSVEITAASQKSAELLTKQAESLMASLKLNGIDVSSVNVVQASQTASGNMDAQYNLDSFRGQTSHEEQGGAGGSSDGRGGNAEGFESVPDEASDAPQRLLNYSV